MNRKLIGQDVTVDARPITNIREERAMNTTNRKLWRLVTAMTFALVLALPIARKAEAEQNLFYMLPMADARAFGQVVVHDFDALILGQLLGDPIPRQAYAFENNIGTSVASAEASENQFVVKASSGGYGSADARAFMEFVVHDPQARGLVKVKVSSKLASTPDQAFKGGVSVGPPPTHLGVSYAGVKIRVAPGGSPFMVSFTDDGKIASLEYPEYPLPDYDLFAAGAQVTCGWDGPEDAAALTCRWMKRVLQYNRVIDAEEGDGSWVKLEASPTFSIAPGLHYVIGIQAFSNYDADAIMDPVLEPHPDNPDITIEFPNAAVNPNPQPLMGDTTPEALLAQGIDPQPFIDLGFFPSSPPPASSDTTSPVTMASPSPGPNGNGWNRSAVTVTLSATDNGGGSGVKEVHYSLDGAATGSQVVTGDSATVTISAEGATMLSYFAVDNAGNQEAAQTLTVGIDKTAPTLAGLPAAGCALWPPDHRLVEVGVVTVQDGLSGSVGAPVVTVTSNEPANGTGDGDLEPDALITGGAVQLRAERAGNGTGRVYTIKATATDLAGNTASATATCKVPHDRPQTAKP